MPPAFSLGTKPQHVAFIMDGNGRWAQQRGLDRSAGHRAGLEKLRELAAWLITRQVPEATVYAFSSENWSRPAEEVSALMNLLSQALKREVKPLVQQGVQLRFIGQREQLAPTIARALTRAEAQSQAGQALRLNVAFAYGAQWDITQAARQAATRYGAEFSSEQLAEGLSLAGRPDPDLLIRTGYEQRLSNFLLWQLAYAELCFVPVLWPDFSESELDQALADYSQRQRRFGGR